MATSSSDGEDLGPGGVTVSEQGAGVATEGDATIAVMMNWDPKASQPVITGEVTIAEAASDVLDHPGAGGELRAHPPERVSLQGRDQTGQQERDPDRGPGDAAGRPQQGEDPRADHRPHTDEGRLAHRHRPRFAAHADPSSRSVRPFRRPRSQASPWT